VSGDEYAEALRWFRENPTWLDGLEAADRVGDQHAATIVRGALAGAAPPAEPREGELAEAVADLEGMAAFLEPGELSASIRKVLAALAGARPAPAEPERCGLAAHGGACDEPRAEGADRCVFHLVEQVRRLQTYSQWASEQMDQLRAAQPGPDAEQAGGDQ
jgi:hypothetical protein